MKNFWLASLSLSIFLISACGGSGATKSYNFQLPQFNFKFDDPLQDDSETTFSQNEGSNDVHPVTIEESVMEVTPMLGPEVNLDAQMKIIQSQFVAIANSRTSAQGTVRIQNGSLAGDLATSRLRLTEVFADWNLKYRKLILLDTAQARAVLLLSTPDKIKEARVFSRESYDYQAAATQRYLKLIDLMLSKIRDDKSASDDDIAAISNEWADLNFGLMDGVRKAEDRRTRLISKSTTDQPWVRAKANNEARRLRNRGTQSPKRNSESDAERRARARNGARDRLNKGPLDVE